jgi:hypothetical protein
MVDKYKQSNQVRLPQKKADPLQFLSTLLIVLDSLYVLTWDLYIRRSYGQFQCDLLRQLLKSVDCVQISETYSPN